MSKIRSAIADFITIFTGLFTLLSGYLSVSIGEVHPASNVEWDISLKHALSITVTFFTFYFFLDASIRASRQIVSSGFSSLPNGFVYVFCSFGGLTLFVVSQLVFQSKIFAEIQSVYLVVPIILWFVLMFALVIHSDMNPSRD